MPGSSLWLIPPKTHPLHALLSSLISETLPSLFPALDTPLFSPHVTLTSEIPPSTYGDDPQGWLAALTYPAAKSVKITFQALDTEAPFFRKCTIRVAKDEGLKTLAGESRKVGVYGRDDRNPEEWIKREYRPHCSLMYADITIDESKRKEIEEAVQAKSVNLDGQGEMGGWTGGQVWLVPTDKAIEEWKPIAVRDLE